MTHGSAWHQAQAKQLQWACMFYDNSDKLFQDGLTTDKIMMILDWLRKAVVASVRVPTISIHGYQDWWINELLERAHQQIFPNAPESSEDLKVAEEFVNELIALQVPVKIHGRPLFCQLSCLTLTPVL